MLLNVRAAICSTRGLERNLPAFLEVDIRNFTDYCTAKSTTLEDGRHNQTTIGRRQYPSVRWTALEWGNAQG